MNNDNKWSCFPLRGLSIGKNKNTWTTDTKQGRRHGMDWKMRIDTCLLHACVLSNFSPVQLSAMLWTVAHQSPLPMGLSRQEYWSRLPCPPSGHLPYPGIEPTTLMSLNPPTLAGRFFITSTIWEAPHIHYFV